MGFFIACRWAFEREWLVYQIGKRILKLCSEHSFRLHIYACSKCFFLMAKLLAQPEVAAFVAALDRSEFPGFAAVRTSAEVFMKQDARSATLLTVKDVMRELNLGRTKVYELIKTEGLPVVRFGRAVRVPMASLQQWISEREEQCLSA